VPPASPDRTPSWRDWFGRFFGPDDRAARYETRGLKLLREWLSAAQLAQFNADGHFDVIGGHSGKTYRIQYGAWMNVHEIDPGGNPLVCWCFIPSGHLVPGDVMLAQKIALETNEIAALAVANRFSPRMLRLNCASPGTPRPDAGEGPVR
jgi:hypothetical protein